MPKRILTTGLSLQSDSAHEEELDAKASLLDWDIILFKPDLSSFMYGAGTYQGKHCLDDTYSFSFKDACAHWRSEIKRAMETGKTVIVFLPELEEIFVASGERTHSGTGRNRQTTRIVVPDTNYSALPISIKPVNSRGTAIKPTPNGADFIAPFWKEFGAMAEYKVLLPTDTKGVFLTTRSGDRPVGAIQRFPGYPGSLLLLPEINFARDEFFEEDEDADGNLVWTALGKQFSARMVAAVVALDKALHASADITPEPGWTTGAIYTLPEEEGLRSELLESERLVEEAQKRKNEIIDRLKAAGQLRALLYEKGSILEDAFASSSYSWICGKLLSGFDFRIRCGV
jgi:hypothetical protein